MKPLRLLAAVRALAVLLADLAVLSQDIFTVAPDALPATKIVLTLVGGRVVFDAGVLQRPGKHARGGTEP
jgi:hypothetical protein